MHRKFPFYLFPVLMLAIFICLTPCQVHAKESLPTSYCNPNLPAIRNQGIYNNCWAFATLACAEAELIQNDGFAKELIDLSELQLAYFVERPAGDPMGYATSADRKPSGSLFAGGNELKAIAALARGESPVYEKECPYSSINSGLYLPSSKAYQNTFYLNHAFYYSKDNREAIKQAVLDYGAALITYVGMNNPEVNNRYYNTKTQAFYSPYTKEEIAAVGDKNTTHSVTIVGWDDSYATSNFSTTPEGPGAWIIRNSYGVSSGDQGYFYLSYYDHSTTNIVAAIDLNKNQGEIDHYYQYDMHRAGERFMNADTDGLALWDIHTFEEYANVFTTKGNAGGTEELRYTSFSTYHANVDYEIRIFTNLTDAADPTSGSLVATYTGTTGAAGFYLIPCDTPLILGQGVTFSVVVKLTKNGESVSLNEELNSDVSLTQNDCGQSYARYQGQWYDMATIPDNCLAPFYQRNNFRIKAYTADSGAGILPKTALTLSARNLSGGVQLSWDKLSEVGGYQIERKSITGDYVPLGDLLDKNTSSFTDTSAIKGKLYTYRVRAFLSTGEPLGSSKEVSISFVPKGTLSSATNVAKGITIKWKKNAYATGYYLYRSKNGSKFTKLKTFTKNTTVSYTDTSATTAGAKYQYRLVAYRTDCAGGKSITSKAATSATLTTYRLTTPTKLALSSKKSKTLTITWAKNTKATGYELRYATNSKFTGAKTVKITSNKTLSKKLTKLKGKKTYYVQIRAIKKVGTKTYVSAYSSTKKLTVKA